MTDFTNSIVRVTPLDYENVSITDVSIIEIIRSRPSHTGLQLRMHYRRKLRRVPPRCIDYLSYPADFNVL